MKTGVLQLALREMRAQLRHPLAPTVILGAAALLAILGPFGTIERLSLLQRIVYWIAMVAGTYAIGVVSGALLGPRLGPQLERRLGPHPGRWASVLVVGTVTGLAILPYVVILNKVAFDYWPEGHDWGQLAGQVLIIAIILTAVLRSIERHFEAGQTRPVGPGQDLGQGHAKPSLLDRLPLEKRGALVALSVEDHYVRVRTEKGEEMLLMRLSDAVREAAATPGLRVHRSHWVALDQVRAARRDGDRAVLTMTTGPEIPASRANVPALRDAGLLPK